MEQNQPRSPKSHPAFSNLPILSGKKFWPPPLNEVSPKRTIDPLKPISKYDVDIDHREYGI